MTVFFVLSTEILRGDCGSRKNLYPSALSIQAAVKQKRKRKYFKHINESSLNYLFTKRHKQIFLFGFGFIEKCVVVRIGDPPLSGDLRVGKIGDLTGDEKDIDGPVVTEPQRERYAAGIAAA